MPQPFDDNIKKIGDQIANLTLIEAKSLIDYMEDTYGVRPLSLMILSEPWKINKPYLETEYNLKNKSLYYYITLESFGHNKIAAIKVLRGVTGLGLKEAKDFVESTPATVREDLAHWEANRIAEEFESIGATVSIREHK